MDEKNCGLRSRGLRPRNRPRKIWREVVEKHLTQQLNVETAIAEIDRRYWIISTKMGNECVFFGISSCGLSRIKSKLLLIVVTVN